MMKGQKGITLVALVITIIVMLILVGVSVTVAINTDLFGTAKDAGADYKAEAEKEAAGQLFEDDKTMQEVIDEHVPAAE